MPPALIVVDASAIVDLVLLNTPAPAIEHAITTADVAAPDILAIEVLSSLRRLERGRAVSPARVAEAEDDFRMLPIRLWRSYEWLDDIWFLRHNVGTYDACYVVLARMLDCPLVTSDARLARAPGLGIRVVFAGE